MTWNAADVEAIARNLVDELLASRPRTENVSGLWKEERWENNYEHTHCYELLELHYESGDAYKANKWKYQPVRDMDEAERCMFNDWAD